MTDLERELAKELIAAYTLITESVRLALQLLYQGGADPITQMAFWNAVQDDGFGTTEIVDYSPSGAGDSDHNAIDLRIQELYKIVDNDDKKNRPPAAETPKT